MNAVRPVPETSSKWTPPLIPPAKRVPRDQHPLCRAGRPRTARMRQQRRQSARIHISALALCGVEVVTEGLYACAVGRTTTEQRGHGTTSSAEQRHQIESSWQTRCGVAVAHQRRARPQLGSEFQPGTKKRVRVATRPITDQQDQVIDYGGTPKRGCITAIRAWESAEEPASSRPLQAVSGYA